VIFATSCQNKFVTVLQNRNEGIGKAITASKRSIPSRERVFPLPKKMRPKELAYYGFYIASRIK